MNELQKAAEILNKNAPVDGPFGKESIAYINPLEAEILKNLGGSGETIIPSADEQMDPVNSYGIFKWFKKKVMDDILGIDDNKTFGIKHKTFLGGAMGKVRDDILGYDSTKTLGISDATLDDALSTVVGIVNPVAGLATTALDKVIENNSGDTSGRQKQREDIAAMKESVRADFRKQQAEALAQGKATFSFKLPDGTTRTYYTDPDNTGTTTGVGSTAGGATGGATTGTEGTTGGATTGGATTGGTTTTGGAQDGGGASASSGSSELDLANQRALVANLVGRGKAGLIDPSDTAKMQQLLARPGDADYVEGFSIGGDYIDPFPEYLSETGDTILGGINDVGKNLNTFIGTPESRMKDYDPIMQKLEGMSDFVINEAQKVLGDGEGSVEQKYKGFQQDFVDLANKQKDLNNRTAVSNQGLVNDVLTAGNEQGKALRDSVLTQAGLADTGFDELQEYTRKGFGNLEDYTKKSYDAGRKFSDLGFDQLKGMTDRGYGTLFDETGNAFDQRLDFSRKGFDELGDSVTKGFNTLGDYTNQSFDALQRGRLTGGLAQAAAQRANATQEAANQRRALNQTGITRGTGSDMASRMIGANLGQSQTGSLADIIRGGSEIEAERLAQLGDIFSRGQIERGQVDSRGLFAEGDLRGARQEALGRIGMDRLFNRGQLSADKTFGAGDLERNRFADLARITSDRDFSRGGIGNDRFQRLSDINPGLANVYKSQSDLQNRLRALDFGDQLLGAEGANLGIDRAILDDRRGLFDSLTNQRLMNSSLIDGLGAQRARLPGFYADAALDPLGGLIRNASPFTSTGLLPSPVSSYNPTPYTGYSSGGGGGFDWMTALRNYKPILEGGKSIINDVRGLFS